MIKRNWIIVALDEDHLGYVIVNKKGGEVIDCGIKIGLAGFLNLIEEWKATCHIITFKPYPKFVKWLSGLDIGTDLYCLNSMLEERRFCNGIVDKGVMSPLERAKYYCNILFNAERNLA